MAGSAQQMAPTPLLSPIGRSVTDTRRTRSSFGNLGLQDLNHFRNQPPCRCMTLSEVAGTQPRWVATPPSHLSDFEERLEKVLALNIEDLNLARKRAAVVGKGGHREVVVWASGAARLLPRYLPGRRRGPVLVTNRQPNQVPAGPDQCPDTGLGRLSYNRALVSVQEGQRRMDTPPATTLSPHLPRRDRSLRNPSPSQKPTPRPPHPRQIRQTRHRSRSRPHRPTDPGKRYPH